MRATWCVYHTLLSLKPCKRNTRYYSSILRTPPPSTGQAPTPLVFVSAPTWDVSSHHDMSAVSSALTQKGYTCLDIGIYLPKGEILTDSPKTMQYFESELKDAIRSAEIAFPPVLIARYSACLIAQSYISSHPASGLFMISPPASNASVENVVLPTHLKEFDFEPRFPIAIMATLKEVEKLSQHNRLAKHSAVDKIYVSRIDGQCLAVEIEKWLDELGM
ncbi:hypothetical protein BDZ94DRAFT_1271290 [Collybia nuda]|uniref:Uncharacterized protein n=1 Tax=Collybia nuda TaxID=64659 RepID=A0A9P5XUX4_9AGAR|nr:hypothetical protein BDZ94DRAFT_1271290 [Collybia nuda]